jgi:hypothetical protein
MNSTPVTVGNGLPVIQVQNIFLNYTVGHKFNVTAGVTDPDGGTDITRTNISSTSGTCVQAKNVTSGTFFNVTYTCTGTALVSTTIIIGFTDSGSNYVGTTPSSNSYPNAIPNMISSTITSNESDFYRTSTLLGWCNATDADADNLAYYYTWFKNGLLNLSGRSAGSYTQATKVNVVNSTAGSISDSWKFECKADDAYSNSTALNSSIAIIIASNSDISFSMLYPTNCSYPKGCTEVACTNCVRAYFNFITNTESSVVPEGQNSTLSFMDFKNTGSIALNWSVAMNESLSKFTLKYDTDSNPTGASTVTTSQLRVASNIAPSADSYAWLWADSLNVAPSDTRQSDLNSSGTNYD